MYDYEGLIRDVVKPEIEKSHFVKPWKDLRAWFSEDTKPLGSSYIVRDIRTSISSNARNYTKADVDPIAGSSVEVTAKWRKIYQETAAEVHNIDINEADEGGLPSITALFQDAVEEEMNGLWSLIYADVYAQLKADLLASGTYSDAALNRSTYPTLAPWNDVTDTEVTIALVRSMMYNTRLNKNTSDKSGYDIMMEPAVYFKFKPLAALLHSWTFNDKNGTDVEAGYQDLSSFEGSRLAIMQGMTTGDVFYTRKSDRFIRMHRALTMTPVPSGRDSIKVIIRCGINAYVANIGKQGMMTNKD